MRSERYVIRHEFCRRLHGRLLYISSARLPIKRNAPEPLNIRVFSQDYLRPVIANVRQLLVLSKFLSFEY
jgi:hypothetical protein